MSFTGLSLADKKALEFEVVSAEARLKLTRLIRAGVRSEESIVALTWQNRAVNIARQVLSLSMYVLEADDHGDFHPAEYSWHNGEVELICKRPNAVQLVETLADLIEDNLLDVGEVNAIVEQDNGSFFFEHSAQSGEVFVSVISIDEIETSQDKHPNIRLLVSRMDTALDQADYSAVLHASASTFETLAKSVVGTSSIEDQTLGGFFARYRKDSSLPAPILDYILEIYNRRNTEPLSGHGSLREPSITEKEATVLVELTKSFVRIERNLEKQAVTPIRAIS